MILIHYPLFISSYNLFKKWFLWKFQWIMNDRFRFNYSSVLGLIHDKLKTSHLLLLSISVTWFQKTLTLQLNSTGMSSNVCLESVSMIAFSTSLSTTDCRYPCEWANYFFAVANIKHFTEILLILGSWSSFNMNMNVISAISEVF